MPPRFRFAAMLFLLPNIAEAQPATLKQINAGLAMFYATATLDTSSGCRAALKMDAEALKYDYALDALKQKGEINPDIPNLYYRDNPAILLTFLSQQDAKSILFFTYYGDRPIDLCHFDIYMKSADQYGHETDSLLLSFDFKRATYHKIDWSNFSTISLPDIAVNYSETPLLQGYEAAAAEEAY